MSSKFLNPLKLRDSEVLKEVEALLGEPCEMVDSGAMPGHYRVSRLKSDILESRHPLCDNPYVYYQWRTRNAIAPGSGITIFSCRGKKDLKYAVVWHVRLYPRIIYIFPKSQRSAILKHMIKSNRYVTGEVKEPIIDPKAMQIFRDSTIGFLDIRQKLIEVGISFSRGVVLTGPPGNGKTMLCAWMEDQFVQNGINVVRIGGAGLMALHGNGELKNFMVNNEVIIIDDIDVGILKRSGAKSTISCDLLSAMDSNKHSRPTLRVITTNEKIVEIDDAFLRPGRIDTIIDINKPTRGMREQYVNQWHESLLSKVLKDKTKKSGMKNLLDETEGMSFSEMEMIKAELGTALLTEGKWNLPQAIESYNSKRKELKAETTTTGFNATGEKQ